MTLPNCDFSHFLFHVQSLASNLRLDVRQTTTSSLSRLHGYMRSYAYIFKLIKFLLIVCNLDPFRRKFSIIMSSIIESCTAYQRLHALNGYPPVARDLLTLKTSSSSLHRNSYIVNRKTENYRSTSVWRDAANQHTAEAVCGDYLVSSLCPG